jgi:hypothetical protein
MLLLPLLLLLLLLVAVMAAVVVAEVAPPRSYLLLDVGLTPLDIVFRLLLDCDTRVDRFRSEALNTGSLLARAAFSISLITMTPMISSVPASNVKRLFERVVQLSA